MLRVLRARPTPRQAPSKRDHGAPAASACLSRASRASLALNATRAVRIYQTELGPDHDETLEAMKFAARMGEATRVTTGGDEPWKANHKSHAWGRAAGQ